MTEVKILKKNDDIFKIDISGHAFYAEYGNDIVCAAISMISYTIANKLLFEQENNVIVNIDNKEGRFSIEVKEIDDLNKILLSTLKMGLQMIEEEYGDNIIIQEV